MKRLLIYMKKYVVESILAPLLKMLEATFELLVPLVVAKMIDAVTEGTGETVYLVKLGGVLALLGFLGFAVSVTAQYFAAKAAVGTATILRREVFKKVHTLSYSQIDKAGVSTLVTRLTSDVNTVQNGINLMLRLFLRSPFIVFGAAIMAVFVDKRSALTFFLTILILAVIVFSVMLISMPLYKKAQYSLDRLTTVTRESLGGARVIRAFAGEDEAKEKFDLANGALNRFQRIAGRVSSLTNPLTYAVLNGAIILLIYTGAIRVEAGAITLGAVVALYNYMSQILVELVKLANLIVTLTKAMTSAARVSAVLNLEAEENGNEVSAEKAVITFDNVSFGYGGGGEYSLKNISFELKPGETLGIIGSTGSGKSTLVNLIGGFYTADEGKVSVGGVDTKKWDKEVLRKTVSYVPQKAVLFMGTVEENIRFGNSNCSEADITNVLKNACAYGFIMEKEGGIRAEVTEGGKNFSGGQRQRLTIARALVRNAPILVLDDSSSALDMATEAKLRENISNLPNKPTVVTVSQRTASVMHADKIIVLEEGEMVGVGKHEELLETCSVYKEIYNSQFDEGSSDEK